MRRGRALPAFDWVPRRVVERIGSARAVARARSTTSVLSTGLVLLAACVAPLPPGGSEGSPRSAVAEIVAPTVVPVLDGETGLLVLHLDTDVPIEALETDRMKMSGALAKGRYVWIVRVPAGRHAWKAITFAQREMQAARPRYCRRARNSPIDPRTELQGVQRSEFEFDVKAGTINYPGELILRGTYGNCDLVGWFRIRNRNHAAMALESLLNTHPAIVAAFPLRNAGASGDGFLEFYDRERGRVAAEPSEAVK